MCSIFILYMSLNIQKSCPISWDDVPRCPKMSQGHSYYDYAGGGVIHLAGAMAALVSWRYGSRSLGMWSFYGRLPSKHGDFGIDQENMVILGVDQENMVIPRTWWFWNWPRKHGDFGSWPRKHGDSKNMVILELTKKTWWFQEHGDFGSWPRKHGDFGSWPRKHGDFKKTWWFKENMVILMGVDQENMVI